MSHEKHGLLKATVLQFAYKLRKKEAFFKLSWMRVYRSIFVCVLNSRNWTSQKCRQVKSVTASVGIFCGKTQKEEGKPQETNLKGEVGQDLCCATLWFVSDHQQCSWGVPQSFGGM